MTGGWLAGSTKVSFKSSGTVTAIVGCRHCSSACPEKAAAVQHSYYSKTVGTLQRSLFVLQSICFQCMWLRTLPMVLLSIIYAMDAYCTAFGVCSSSCH
jgi:hypothetical protein